MINLKDIIEDLKLGKVYTDKDRPPFKVESTASYAASLEKIAKDKQLKSLSKKDRAATAKKKKKAGAKGKTVVKNTKNAEVKNLKNGGEIKTTKPKRPFRGKSKKGTAVAKGCGAIMPDRRKRTKGAVRQF